MVTTDSRQLQVKIIENSLYSELYEYQLSFYGLELEIN